MDEFVVLFFHKIEGEDFVSVFLCPSLLAAEFFIMILRNKEEISIIALVDKKRKAVSLEKGKSLVPFLVWLKKNVPEWKAGA
ncbi:MAG: hypothetical protein WC435_02680 [Candidatus Paceibacterota bacterium]